MIRQQHPRIAGRAGTAVAAGLAIGLTAGLLLAVAPVSADAAGSVLDALSPEVRDLVTPEQAAVLEGLDRWQALHPDAGPVTVCWSRGTDPRVVGAFSALLDPEGTAYYIQNRWSQTATDGAGLGQGDPTTLTWGLLPDGVPIFDADFGNTLNSNLIVTLDNLYGSGPGGNDLTQRPWFPLVQSAVDGWSAVSGVRYVYEPNDDGAAFPGSAGILGVRPDVRIGGRALDGRLGILGYNYYPNGGDMVLDTTDDLYLNNRANNSVAMRNLVGHELGHGLGLRHSCPVEGTKLMEPTVASGFDGPQHDDILGVNELYGDRLEFPSGNDGIAGASDLGAMADGDTLDLGNLSIENSQDHDYLAFTVPDRMRVSLDLNPVGFVYYNAEESGDSCPLGFFINTQNRNDLGMELLGPSGTLLAGADAHPEGLPETIPQIILDQGAGTYFVHVFGDTNKVQLYDLRIVASAGQAPVAVCKDVTSCRADVNPTRFDNGSYDPDGDAITMTVDPEPPYPPGETTVTVAWSDGILADTCTATVTVDRPPVAAARAAVTVTAAACPAPVPPDSLDDGSYDPDGDALTLSLVPPGPYGEGATPVLFIATDPCGASDTASAVVNVTCTVPVTLLAFRAAWDGGAVVVTWEVADARDHAGFHLYREAGGGARTRISEALLSGETRYRFVDPSPPASGAVRYWLEEVGRSGETTWYGPATLAGTPVTALVLGRARPNPFAGSTAWRLAVPPGTGRVDFSVYDTRGRRVRTLIAGDPGSGEFDVAWSGDTDGGGRAPAGLYFVRLRAGGEVRLQKIVRIP